MSRFFARKLDNYRLIRFLSQKAGYYGSLKVDVIIIGPGRVLPIITGLALSKRAKIFLYIKLTLCITKPRVLCRMKNDGSITRVGFPA